MKKAFVLVALSLTMLPSLAETQRLWISGYRIGDSAVSANDERIVATNVHGQVVKDSTTAIMVEESIGYSNAYFNISVPAGQEVKKWLAYNSDPTDILRPPTETNQLAGAMTEYVWSYNPNDTSNKYIVVDFDYITYTLKYNSGSGSTSSESHIYTNNFNLASNQFSKTGYSFNGWTNETGAVFADGASVSGESFGVTYTNTTTKTANLYAHWTPNAYTVTLDPCDGSVDPESVDVTYDAAWPALPTPTRDGYRFAGWFTAATGGTEINTNSTYATAANTTNYAHWAELVTATFKDGHTGETLKTETLDKGGTPTPPEAPEHAGYYSTGWAPAISAISVNTVFTMQYAQYSYTVVFHADNGTGAEQTQQFTYNAAEAPLNSVASMEGFLITGYNFQNWTNSAGNAYADGELVSNLAQSGEYHLYAVWTLTAYTIAFDGNGADNPDAMDEDTMTLEGAETKPLVANKFVKGGYAFAGWATNEASSVAFTNCQDVVSTNLWMGADETNVLYAVWQPNSYTVVFNSNGGTGSMDDQVFYYDQAQTLARCDFISNLEFRGWATNQEGKVAFDDQATVSNLTAEANGIVELYAVWSNGDLSDAMHCDNLFWAQDDSSGTTNWAACIGDKYGYNPSDSLPSGSSVCAIVLDYQEKSYVMMPSGASGAGKLSFWYKMSSSDAAECWLKFSADGNDWLTVQPQTQWTQYAVDIEHIENVKLFFAIVNEFTPSKESYTVWIDQMTWEPDGSEVPEDPEAIKLSLQNALVNGVEAVEKYASSAGGTYVKRDHAAPRVTYTAELAPEEGVEFDSWELTLGETTHYIAGNPLVLDGNSSYFSETTESNCYVRANFTWLNYQIDYNANDGHGTVTPDTNNYIYTNEVALASASPSAGYSFAGWTTNATDEFIFEPGRVVTGADIGATTSGVVTLYANWTQNVYSVTFCYTNSEGVAESLVRSVLGTKDAVPPDATAYDSWVGHKFVGWDASYSNVVSDVTVNALYEEGKSYKVRFEPGDGVTGSMDDMKYFAEVEQGIASNAFVKVGYVFVGWAVEEGGDAVYADGQVVSFTADTTLYAVWTPIEYVVKFDPNGGEGTMGDQEFVYDQAQPLAACEFTSDLAFLGWATDAAGGVVFADGETVSNLTAEDGGTVTLYAVWLTPLVVGEYFKATLVDLGYDVPNDGKTAYSVVAKGLPAGLSLKYNAAVKNKKGKVTKPAKVEWWIEGVPTAALDFDTRPAYLVITANGVTKTLPLPLEVLPQNVTQLDGLALGESINEQYYLPGVTSGWTVTGLPAGLKYTAKLVTTKKKSGRKTIVTTNALPYSVYGKTTKAGLYTITAKKKVASFYETMKYRVLVTPAAVDASRFGEELTNITTMAYVPFEWDLTNDVAAVGGKVAKVTGLPTGLTFAASNVYAYKNAKKKTGKYLKQAAQTIVGTPTKAGTYVVTFTKNVKSGKKTVAKTAQILWVVTANDAELSLGFNESGGIIESGSVGLRYADLMAFTATEGATVTASGLPAGITLVDLGGGNWGFKGYTTKAGTYLVTVKATLNGKTVTQRVALKVDGLPAWAKGTFNGYVSGDVSTNGLATVTVSSVGKISGKFQELGTNWTFSAACYTDAADTFICTNVVATYSYKVTTKVNGQKKTVTKKLMRTFALEVSSDELGGVAVLVEDGGAMVKAWQNLWARTDYKALGKKLFYISKTKPYRTFSVKVYKDDEGQFYFADEGNETYFAALSLKVTPNGAVVATMSFDTGKTKKDSKTKKTVKVIYKPTCATVVIPTSAATADPFTGEAFLYFAPSPGNNFPGFVGVVPF